MTRRQWDDSARAVDARLPRLQRHEIIVELMRLVAMVGDGHTAFALEAGAGFHRLPIELRDFSDGLFIVSADSAHAGLVGARVVRIGAAYAADAMRRAGQVIPHESPNWVRARAPALLVMPEVLSALGMGRDANSAVFTIAHGTREQVVVLTGSGLATDPASLTAAQQVEMSARAIADVPLYRQHTDDAFWYTILPGRTLYIGYRAVAFIANGTLNEQFFRQAFLAADSSGADRVVLDMRSNGGGNNFLNRFVVKEIVRRPSLDRSGKCLVLIGRDVFSAAQNLVNELDYYTDCTFVGEPTGNSPNQYGDARPLVLPRSGLRVMVSTRLWQGHDAGDARTWFPPDVYVEQTSADYASRRDPVLDAALARATTPTLAQTLAEFAEQGDTLALRRAVDRYRANRENRYRNHEADINAAGYEFLRAAKLPAAVAIFQINTRLFPNSGNAFDSLGEAFERSNRKDEAIAAYRKALSLDQGLFTSRDGLRRLGALP